MSEASVPNPAYIQATRVTGTKVYSPEGEHLGAIDDIVLTKVEGQAVYAVLSFGGFFGMGDRRHPLPWSILRYDTDFGGYVVNLTREQVENAPSYAPDAPPDWDEPGFGGRVSDHYRPPVVHPAHGERTI